MKTVCTYVVCKGTLHIHMYYWYFSVSPTFKLHPHVETFLEPAVRASLPLRLINNTVPVCHTGVHLLVLHGPLEESLAGLAGEDPVVEA